MARTTARPTARIRSKFRMPGDRVNPSIDLSAPSSHLACTGAIDGPEVAAADSHFCDVDRASEPRSPPIRFATPDPNDHIDLLAGADVFFVEYDTEFFGVGSPPTVRQLDKAYRLKAISMHPDKNGGSKAAKEAFHSVSPD